MTDDPDERVTLRRLPEVEIGTPTQIDPPRERSEPLRVISMKTPGVADANARARVNSAAPPQLRQPRIRALSEVSAHATPPRGMGNLAPPRDPKEARTRRVRDAVIWGSLAVLLACGVTLAIWFLAR